MKMRQKMLAIIMSVSVATSMIPAMGSVVYAEDETNTEQTQTEDEESSQKTNTVKYEKPVYSWEGNNCTATAKGSDGSKQTETVAVTEQITTPAGCETNGVMTYTAKFKNEIFKPQTKNVEIPATGHSFGDVSYSWNDTQCTASRNCGDCGKTEEETVTASEEVTIPAGSTTAGEKTYTAVFSNGAFSTQTRTEEIEAAGEETEETSDTDNAVQNDNLFQDSNTGLNDDLSQDNNDSSVKATYTISYKWEAKQDGSGYQCTATRTSTDPQEEPQTETVDAVMDESKIKAATCTESGLEVYTADFSADFTDQAQLDAETGKITDRVTTAPLGHMYVQAKYNWTKTDGGYVCVAESVCENNKSHVLKEEAEVELMETKSPTCTEKGEETYTATFKQQPFTTQEKKEEIQPLGHLYVIPAYTWKETNDGYECIAKCVCDNNPKHVLTETVQAVEKITKAPSCETEGAAYYTAAFKNDTFKPQKKNVKVAATGHNYAAAEYAWEKTDNGYQCTAQRVCENDSSHVETETETAEYKVTKEATTQAKGEAVYTVTFKNTAFEKQTKTVELPVVTKSKSTSSGSTASNKTAQAASDAKQKSSVKTGDETQPWIPIALGLGALAVIAGAGIKLRKKN